MKKPRPYVLAAIAVTVVADRWLPPASAECPTADEAVEFEVPTMFNGSDTVFTCARVYKGFGDDQQIQGCNRCDSDDFDFYDVAADGNFTGGSSCAPVGSILVSPGCTFYGFSQPDFQGEPLELTGLQSKVSGPELEPSEHCADCFYSYVCQCQQYIPDCVPEDGYDVVLDCDASARTTEVKCDYSVSVGSTYSQTVAEGMSQSGSVSSSVQVGIAKMFEASLGVSVETGYDWSKTKSKTTTLQDAVELTVSASVPAGTRLQIQQAVGNCNGNTGVTESTIFTELFRFVHTGSSGEIRTSLGSLHFGEGGESSLRMAEEDPVRVSLTVARKNK